MGALKFLRWVVLLVLLVPFAIRVALNASTMLPIVSGAVAFVAGGGALFRWHVVHGLRSALGGATRGDLPADGEEVAISGRVLGGHEDGADPAVPVFDDEPAVLVGWTLEMYRGTSQRHRGWHPVAMGVSGVPFVVDDGAQRVPVVPNEHIWTHEGLFTWAGPQLCFTEGMRAEQAVVDGTDYDGEVVWGADEATPAGVDDVVQEAAEGMDDIFQMLSLSDADAKRRYREMYVQPGDDVVVRGTVESAGGVRAITPDEDRSLFVSTRKLPDVRATLRSRYGRWAAVGAGSSLVLVASLLFL